MADDVAAFSGLVPYKLTGVKVLEGEGSELGRGTFGQMEITESGNGNEKWKRSSGEKPPSEYTHHSR